ncbi:TPA: type 1 fimbrial protein [Enterobacter hormaechei subsp. steigerwaltii]|nr:type 1 fimbrial protein [Enterobacter hormaechei subsp. steigerwaltii]
MPLLTNSISLGKDAPVGTVLYRQTITPSGTYDIKCDSTTDVTFSYVIAGTVSAYSGSYPYDHVFDTGYAGIGYAVWNTRRNISYSFGLSSYSVITGVTSYSVEKDDMQMEFALIKTGDIAAGVLDLDSLTVSSFRVKTSSTSTAFALKFTGSLNITLPTCTTPDYTVNLGKWGQARFNGKGAASAWVDSSIRLTGCGQFNGNFTAKTGSTNVWSDNGDYSAAAPEQNRWSVSLSSVNGVIDADSGIISTDASATDAAQGLGIQLCQGLTESGGTSLVKIGGSALTGTFTTSGETSYVIPLSARIIQIEDSVVAGNITGKVVYTLNYL